MKKAVLAILLSTAAIVAGPVACSKGDDKAAATYTVGTELGISKAAVVARRTELGIGSVTGTKSAFDWTPEAVAMLGTASDAKVAQQLGLSRLTVYNARLARGIEAAARSKPAPADKE